MFKLFNLLKSRLYCAKNQKEESMVSTDDDLW